MTVDGIMRLSQEAYDILRNLAFERPRLWADETTDFGEVLRTEGIDNYCAETDVTVKGMLDLTFHETFRARPSLADRQALDFYNALGGLTPGNATDPLLWAWLAHFVLHDYCVQRWPLRRKEATQHILQHYFLSDMSLGLFQLNVASRPWWLAHTALKAANASDGALTARQVVNYFAEHAQHYHTIVMRESLRNDIVLAEFIRALINDGKGINNEGVKAIWRKLNLYAGGILVESLPRDLLRMKLVEFVEAVMSEPDYVADRARLRNPSGLIRVLSLGAGVQSTVLALMAERGEYGLSKPDMAIFADTQWEPNTVYEHLTWLEQQLSFPVVRVSAGNIRENILKGTAPDGHRFLGIPAFTINADGTKGTLIRQCTSDYKLDPIRSYLRSHLGLIPGRRAPKQVGVEMWLGISVDEALRQKPSNLEWITHRYPLIEREFSRAQLQDWFNANYPGRELPKSACVGCPYHSDGAWKQMKESDPDAFRDAVYIDWALRNSVVTRGAVKGTAYLHASRRPLSEVDFSEAVRYDEAMLAECEGLCGI